MTEAAGRIGAPGLMRFALRSAACLAWLMVCVVLHGLWRLFTRHSPWPRRFLGGLCRICGIRVKRVGSPAPGGAVLLANHVSWIDVPALAGATGTAFVAHDGLARHPVMRWLCGFNDTVFVARHDRNSVHRQVEQVREAIRDTGALTLFPEGTTSHGTGLLPFKSSLLAAIAPPPPGVAIQPVVLVYGPRAAAIAWVGEEPGTANFLRVLAGRDSVELIVRFLGPLDPDRTSDRKSIAHAAREAMLAAVPGWN
jgi:1-acyl-sn-glycerol-3-phosphate acyltransferase